MCIKILSIPDDGKFIVGNYYKIEFMLGNKVSVYDESNDYIVLPLDGNYFQIVV